MFEARLKIVLGVFGLALLAIVVRLLDLQVVRAEYYHRQAEEAILRRPHVLPFVRGRILDRVGNELAADQPCWEIAVDYGVLAREAGSLQRWASRLRRESADPKPTMAEAQRELDDRIGRMWTDLATFSGESVSDLGERADGIRDRVVRVRETVMKRRGFDAPVAEETMRHAVVTGLDDQEQVLARGLLQDYPWAEVRDATYRQYHASAALAHMVGQLGAVTAENLADDPAPDDELARYLASETRGISGVEWAAENRLRGQRGSFQTNREGETVENEPAVPGENVTLTIRLDLQEALYELMGEILPQTPHPAGGSIVVLDVPTRDVLALVSYPGYDNNRFRQDYTELARDMHRQPLRFRAVANAYAPGSIIKPLTCAAGLSTGKITLDTTFECQGYYYPETRTGKKCWRIHGTDRRASHGALTVTDALAHSCNIFLYHTGERLGVDALCSFFDMAGIGRKGGAGTGLREDARGVNPTPGFLLNNRGRAVAKGDAWNYAIGQGEVTLTPIQAANLMAVYASGGFKFARLIRNRPESPEWKLPVDAKHWRALRTGLYRVTNQPGATAFRHAHFVRDGYALCGKTGSATVYPWAVAYVVPYTTAEGIELTAVVRANSRHEAIQSMQRDDQYRDVNIDRKEVKPCEYWPPLPHGRSRLVTDDQKEHAWFVGYLQAVDADGRPRLEVTPRIAFAVLVEFGGSGGQAAGPIAKQVAATLLDILGTELDPDAQEGAAG